MAEKIDCQEWGCPDCNLRITIRNNAIYKKHSHIPILILTKIIFCYFAEGINAKKTAISINTRFNPVFKIKYAIVKKIFSEIRSQITDYVNILSMGVKLGGVGKKVEIDESLFSHLSIKYKHKKASSYQIWEYMKEILTIFEFS